MVFPSITWIVNCWWCRNELRKFIKLSSVILECRWVWVSEPIAIYIFQFLGSFVLLVVPICYFFAIFLQICPTITGNSILKKIKHNKFQSSQQFFFRNRLRSVHPYVPEVCCVSSISTNPTNHGFSKVSHLSFPPLLLISELHIKEKEEIEEIFKIPHTMSNFSIQAKPHTWDN